MTNQLVQQVEKKITPLEIINVDKAKKVLSGKLISDSTEDEIKDKLKIIYAMIGLRPQHFPVDEEKQFLHQYITSKYGNKTLNELVLAFDLAIQNQLDVEDVKVYDQFSCEYVARIMNGYRKWLLSVKKNSETIKEEPKMISEPKQLTDEEWEEWLTDIKSYKLEMIPVSAYDYLLRKGRINLTTKNKKDYMNKAMPIYAVSIQENVRMWNEFIKMKGENKVTGNHFDSLVVISKRLIIQDYFNKA